MGSVKPWQILLFIAAIGSLAFAAWNVLGGEKVRLSTTFHMVDVTTGELWVADGAKRVSIPARHPESDRYLLLVVTEDEDGNWRLGRSMDSVQALDTPPTIQITDGDRVEVVNPGSPKRYRR